ncbi:nickel/cobalt transporter [Rhodoligotrophos defluvii]|uniref:nickel/cobalt transporter n=1 Tax=Rhodoligotrophos defluvii TaxID=2561934 RepID=UPI0010C9867F|nr:nickel/cobalt transporter [Rhodoligotrophos defluvii]
MLRLIASALLLLATIFLVHPSTPAAAGDGAGAHPLRPGQLAAPPSATDDPSVRQLGTFQRAEIWLRKTQQSFYRDMTEALKVLRERWSFAAGWSLALVSFLYGVFHAAGPGHGKAVISAYLLANERQLKRGIQLAFLSSLFQALSAIILVSGVLLFARAAFGTARVMSHYMELASYLLIAAMGAVMLWRAVKGLLPSPQPALAAAGAGGRMPAAALDHDHHHQHDHQHQHGPDCGCGHSHMPGPTETEGDWSLKRALAISLAVGIRPCSGALIVLLFASSVGIYLVGIGATFAMALGTAITVSAIALLAVSSRGLALRLAGGSDRIYRAVSSGLAVLGGLALITLGLMLFEVTVTTPANPLL